MQKIQFLEKISICQIQTNSIVRSATIDTTKIHKLKVNLDTKPQRQSNCKSRIQNSTGLNSTQKKTLTSLFLPKSLQSATYFRMPTDTTNLQIWKRYPQNQSKTSLHTLPKSVHNSTSLQRMINSKKNNLVAIMSNILHSPKLRPQTSNFTKCLIRLFLWSFGSKEQAMS